MRKPACLGMALVLLSLLVSVSALADDEDDSGVESSTEYTGIKEMSLGIAVVPYAPLRGNAEFLYRMSVPPKEGVGIIQLGRVDFSPRLRGEAVQLIGWELNLGAGLFSNREKKKWFGAHVFLGLGFLLVKADNENYDPKYTIGNEKFVNVGFDFYPQLLGDRVAVKGDSFYSFFIGMQAAVRDAFLNLKSDNSASHLHSSLSDNFVVRLGARTSF